MNAMTVGGDRSVDEAIRVQAILQRRRTALLVGVLVTAVVGVMGFWVVDFGLLGIARGWLTYGGAVLFGALLGGGSWFLLRPKERAFEALPAPVEERPPADDDARAFARELRSSGPAAPADERVSAPPMTADLDATVARVRRVQRRNRFAVIVASIVGVALALGLLELIAWLYGRANNAASDYDDLSIGPPEMLVAGFAGFLVGTVLQRLLRSRESLEDPPAAVPAPRTDIDWFERTLESTGRLTVRRAMDLGEALTGVEADARFEVLDGGGAQLCLAAERSSLLSRLFLGARRPVRVEVRDLDRSVLRIAQPFALLGGTAAVEGEAGPIGRLDIGPLGSMVVADAAGASRLSLSRGLFFRRRYRILRGGAVAGTIIRRRKSLFASSLDNSAAVDVELPRDTDPTERRLLLAAALLVAG